jgi:tRNA pseudouridine55 synthase
MGIVRRALSKAKVGYAGTLDPFATGVLPIAIGSATRLIPYLMETSKVYRATVQWGEERDTDDRTGAPTQVSSVTPTRAAILEILPRFTGLIAQVPPVFSAIKIRGKRACDRVRKGESVRLEPRRVLVECIELLTHEQETRQTTFQITCGTGVYIRSLARDFGRMLRSFGHVHALRRVRVGRFLVENAIPLEKMRSMVHSVAGYVLPSEEALREDLAAHPVQAPLQKGEALDVPLEKQGSLIRLIHEESGALLGLASPEGGKWCCVWRS